MLIVDGSDSTVVFGFDRIIELANWSRYESFDEKVAACQIPDSIINRLSVKSLYTLCIDYPLGPSCFFYNDTQLGFERIMNAFNGYTELKKRLYSFTGPYTSWTWDVESDKTGESVVGQYATITQNQYAGYPSVNITISHAGDYDIVCTFSNAYRTEEWRYQVFVDPDEE